MKFNIVYEFNKKGKEKANMIQKYYVFQNKTLVEALQIISIYENDENYKFIRMIESQEN